MSDNKVSSFLKSLASFHAYVTAVLLIIYMVSTLGMAVYTFVSNFNIILLSSTDPTTEFLRQSEVLHDLAMAFVFYKAFRVVLSYAQSGHVSLKFMFEIAIVGPIVEIVFNVRTFSTDTAMLLGGFAAIMSIIYLYFYKTIKLIESDQQKNGYK